MVRQGLDPDSATVILDVTPSGNVEFMTRSTKGGEMTYVAGTTVTFPVWLRLSNTGGSGAPIDLNPAVSHDGVVWEPVGPGRTLPSSSQFYAGVGVTSHDTSQLNTVHLRGLSLYRGFATGPFEIGDTGLIGNIAEEITADGFARAITVEGAGSDIWGAADSFEFAAVAPPINNPSTNLLLHEVDSLDAAHPFAKAGVMFRDGLAPGAASVILDAKPDGGIEFMARLCSGCETTFIAGANIGLPVILILGRNGSTFTAAVAVSDFTEATTIGSVVVPMSDGVGGLAVTSHDPGRLAKAEFDQ